MALPQGLTGKLRIPAIAAPMFLVSGVRLVSETCRAGVLGTFPALNARTTDQFGDWLDRIEAALEGDGAAAPYGVNLIVNRSNARLEADLAMVVKHRVPLVITSLGAVSELVDAVHGYGGLVFHDVINARHADKAIEAGADGIIAVAAGAGGHAGTTHPFALLDELKPIVGDRALILSGAISNGRSIAAARVAGADLAYLGTRFIATRESDAAPDYKAMIQAAAADDIIYTPKISGVNANFMRQSLERNGIDLATLERPGHLDIAEEARAWKTIWSAGQGVSGIGDLPSVAELCARLEEEYHAALAAVR